MLFFFWYVFQFEPSPGLGAASCYYTNGIQEVESG